MIEKSDKTSTQVNDSSSGLILGLLNRHWQIITTVFFILVVGLLLWLFSRPILELSFYEQHLALITKFSSLGLNTIGIEHQLQRAFLPTHNDLIATDVVNVRLVIDSTYDGLAPFICVAALVLIVGGRWPIKIVYLMISGLIIYTTTIAMTVSVVAIEQHFPLYFDIAQLFLVPVIFIFVPIIGLVYGWLRITGWRIST